MYRFFLSSLAGACLVLLAGCRQEPPEQAAKPKPHDPYATTLRFDKRYYDSIMGPAPYSARTLRQHAIYTQLGRLDQAKRVALIAARNKMPDTSAVEERLSTLRKTKKGFVTDTTTSWKTFPNLAAQLADIRHHIDSLEVLEQASPPSH